MRPHRRSLALALVLVTTAVAAAGGASGDDVSQFKDAGAGSDDASAKDSTVGPDFGDHPLVMLRVCLFGQVAAEPG